MQESHAFLAGDINRLTVRCPDMALPDNEAAKQLYLAREPAHQNAHPKQSQQYAVYLAAGTKEVFQRYSVCI